MTTKPETYEKREIGMLVIAGKLESALPLEHTAVTVTIQGPVASLAVIQRFGNPMKIPVELEYLYPLPADAAVVDFVLRMGDRVIRADLRETAQAQQVYAEALEHGRQAGLLEQRRPNLFAVRLANVLPGETVSAEMRLQQRVSFSGDGVEFVFPMGLTPRYVSPDDQDAGKGVNAPVAGKAEPVGPVEISVMVDAGAACTDPTSPSHMLEVTRLDERRFSTRLAGHVIPDHDFVLRYAVTGEEVKSAAWTAAGKDGGTFLVSLLPPRSDTAITAPPREFIFVMDRSGSMGGEPILQARNALRACLRALNPEDSFSILFFDHEVEWYAVEPQLVTQAAVEQADAYLTGVEARGGTEITAALSAALERPADRKRMRFVVFLTDGAVAAEQRTLDVLRSRLGDARVFTFGIGSSVNRALLAQMARQGRGAAEFLQSNEDIEGAVIRFQDKVSFPVMTDVHLEAAGGQVWDVLPERLPDLYLGQALEVCGKVRWKGAAAVRLTLTGKVAGKTVRLPVELPVNRVEDAALSRLWARARVDDLVEQMQLGLLNAEHTRAAVIELALAHRLVTEYTAFVGVADGQVTSGGKPLTIAVAQPLPAGLNFPAGTPQLPQFQRIPNPAASPMVAMASMKSSPRSLRSSADATQLPSMPPMGFAAKSMEGEKSAIPDREAILRRLARSQHVDGSWEGDVACTAAALLAFVRAGNSTAHGSYRQSLRKALAWLEAHAGQGFARFARARALRELAETGGVKELIALAESAHTALPQPVTPAEKAALGLPVVEKMVDESEVWRVAGLQGQMPEGEIKMPATVEAQTWRAVAQITIQ
ncbi:MAG: VWA domain-containing protein [Anaerolineae bacterium]|nr:VWA domain-containing protein [Anaerolineae bacterium]